jgi:hypothetical protein
VIPHRTITREATAVWHVSAAHWPAGYPGRAGHRMVHVDVGDYRDPVCSHVLSAADASGLAAVLRGIATADTMAGRPVSAFSLGATAAVLVTIHMAPVDLRELAAAMGAAASACDGDA